MFTVLANWDNKLYINNIGDRHDNNFILIDEFPSEKRIKSISYGNSCCIIYTMNGELYHFEIPNERRKFKGLTLLLKNPDIKNIVCGDNYMILYENNGNLWIFEDGRSPILKMTDTTIKLIGCNEYGILIYKNDGTLLNINKYKEVTILEDTLIQSIYCGSKSALIYKNDGSLYGFGDNSKGQLGIGHNVYQDKPVFILKDPSIKIIACGNYHVLYYTENGDLYGFGCNSNSKLGLDLDIYYKPTFILKDKCIVTIACGQNHSLIYKNNGEIYAFGYNIKPTLIWTDPSIKFLMNHKTNIEWNPENHNNFPETYKNIIFTFLLCNRRKYLGLNMRIPKYIYFEIFRDLFKD